MNLFKNKNKKVIAEFRWCDDEQTGKFNSLKDCKKSAIEWINHFKEEECYKENNYTEDIKRITASKTIESLNKICFDYQFYYKYLK